ncbi:hypothetical protein WA026_005422 [Henosepilachna vigintioctopunctata]|uniref:Uncharacterized protein n=1 Tax=Henosepilachna vigintioctopunctata TaxID=420089 RepID=A0AAW1U0W5_9CUCU
MIKILRRRPSIRVDNWDYIYTERSSCSNVNEARVRCPIHRYGPERPDLRRDSSEPELPLDARKSATLRRHYYPEGSWGWVVVVCSVLVHLLNHGLQLSSSQLVAPGVEKFKIERVHLAEFENSDLVPPEAMEIQKIKQDLPNVIALSMYCHRQLRRSDHETIPKNQNDMR